MSFWVYSESSIELSWEPRPFSILVLEHYSRFFDSKESASTFGFSCFYACGSTSWIGWRCNGDDDDGDSAVTIANAPLYTHNSVQSYIGNKQEWMKNWNVVFQLSVLR